MAKTNAGKKYIKVHSYKKKNGTTVKAHCKSTYNK